MINGKDLHIRMKINGIYYTVAAAKECSFKVTHDLVEIVPDQNWAWKKYTNGKQSWELSTSGLVQYITPQVQVAGGHAQPSAMPLHVGEQVDVLFQWEYSNNGTPVTIGYQGLAYIKSMQINASIRKMATYSISLQGSGPLSNHMQ